jgi:aquaporin Z
MADEPERKGAPLDRPLLGAPFPPTRLHPDLYLAEFAGTALLVSIGVSVVILMFGQGSPLPNAVPSVGLRRFVTGALFGSVAALITVSPIGRVSGAHLNPAVTLAFWLEGKLAWRDAVSYVLAQFAGGAVGALPLLAWGRIGRSVAFGATEPGAEIPLWVALLGEAAVTFLLIVTMLTTAAHPRTRNFTPLTIPVLFSVLVWLEAPISGTSANPARSFGPALIGGGLADQWIYILGPSLGAILAIGFIRVETFGLPRVTAARLFHFHLR